MATRSEISRAKRALPPAHYILKIEKYSLLSKANGDRYESGVFKTKDKFTNQEYNWRLIFYPNGKKGQGTGYISLYLALDYERTVFFKSNRMVSFNYKFFVHDQIKNDYLVVQYDDGAVMNFHSQKRECGIDQLLPLQAFKDPSNGYLVDDSCAFGAEIFVINGTGKGEVLSMFKVPEDKKILRWKFPKFSAMEDRDYGSDLLNDGERNWRIVISPMGDSEGKGNYLSLYIRLDGPEAIFSSSRKVYAEYKMGVLEMNTGERDEETSSCWFSNETRESGYPCFMTRDRLFEGGYLMDDTLFVEVELLVVSKVKD